jgi:hypothetical protein
LTEIVAVVALAKVSFLAGLAGLDRLVVIFAAPDLAVEAPLEPPEPVAHTTPGAWLDAAPQPVEICCLKGSLLLNWLKETSWPASGGSGPAGSEIPSAVVAAAEAVEAPEALLAVPVEPSSDGGARAGVSEIVEVVVDGELDCAV